MVYSVIVSNMLDSGAIRNNKMTNSWISHNTLTIYSYISDNTLITTTSVSEISYNTLIGESKIINNLLSSSNIKRNTLDYSTFDFSPSGTLTLKLVIYIQAHFANAVSNISSATVISSSILSKQMFRNSAGVTRLGYYNASDVFTVVNVNA